MCTIFGKFTNIDPKFEQELIFCSKTIYQLKLIMKKVNPSTITIFVLEKVKINTCPTFDIFLSKFLNKLIKGKGFCFDIFSIIHKMGHISLIQINKKRENME